MPGWSARKGRCDHFLVAMLRGFPMRVLRKLVIEEVSDLRDGLKKLSEYMESKSIKGQEVLYDISAERLVIL